jgi:hypothetical protein
MNASAAASLTAALLVPKGNAHPNRGIAQPIRERVGIAVRDGNLFRSEAARLPQPPFVPQKALASGDYKRISLRLTEQQRQRLRLASAHLSKSAQAILFDALDHYLKHVVPELLSNPCPCLAKRGGNGRHYCERTGE